MNINFGTLFQTLASTLVTAAVSQLFGSKAAQATAPIVDPLIEAVDGATGSNGHIDEAGLKTELRNIVESALGAAKVMLEQKIDAAIDHNVSDPAVKAALIAEINASIDALDVKL